MSIKQTFERKSSTILRTFRLPRELNTSLEVEARNRGLSVNALVSSLISKFDNWDRFADRLPFISTTDELFKTFLSEVDDEKIVSMAETVGPRVVREAMIFWSKETSVDSFVKYLNNRCRYAGYGNFEYEKKGTTHVMALQHSLGSKWSLFLHHVMDNVLRKSLGIVAHFDVSESSVMARFTD
ncbi:MAG TPA: hypothetical protein VLV18_03025 [Terriglobales bacterium]|nr:hypothetical protein [Terriglobales bacterium]